MEFDAILLALGIFMLRVVGNMITTIRLILMVRGEKLASSALGALEALIFAIALGSVVSNLGDILNLTAYCVGFGVGGYLGLILEYRLVQRFVAVQAISTTRADEIAEAVRGAGFGATQSWGLGAEGEVGIVTVVVVHKDVRKVTSIIQTDDPEAFVTYEDLRSVSQGYFRRMARLPR